MHLDVKGTKRKKGAPKTCSVCIVCRLQPFVCPKPFEQDTSKNQDTTPDQGIKNTSALFVLTITKHTFSYPYMCTSRPCAWGPFTHGILCLRAFTSSPNLVLTALTCVLCLCGCAVHVAMWVQPFPFGLFRQAVLATQLCVHLVHGCNVLVCQCCFDISCQCFVGCKEQYINFVSPQACADTAVFLLLRESDTNGKNDMCKQTICSEMTQLCQNAVLVVLLQCQSHDSTLISAPWCL